MSTTLLITTRNRTPLLRKSLSRLLLLTPPDEIIVVDDGGDDGCDEACWQLTRKGLPITYLYLDRPYDSNPCLPRNMGIKLAKGDEILVSEPEVLFLSDVIAQLTEARKELPDNPLFGGTYHADQEYANAYPVPPPPAHHTPPLSTLVVQYPHYTLYRREWLEEVGGYDESLPGSWAFDDVDLNQRLGEAGHFTVLISGARAFHQWHEPRNNAAQADLNEAVVRSKVWPRDIVANAGREWGIA